MHIKRYAPFTILAALVLGLPSIANAECKADPTSIFKVGKVYASADLTRLTDENCKDVAYRPDYTKAMKYKGAVYVMKVQKVDDGTGPVASYKIISLQKE